MNPERFFTYVRVHLFGGRLAQTQVDGMNAIVSTWGKLGDGDDRKLANVLGTTFWETARTMQPIEEYGHGRGHSYGLPTGPWHQIYDGRGDVQLTWLANYVKATQELHKRGMFLDVDLAKNPELALRQDIAAAVMILGMLEGWFTGAKLSDYIHDNVCDYVNCRRIVNGLDHASEIAGFSTLFEQALSQ